MLTAIQKVLEFCGGILIAFQRDSVESEYERGYRAAVEDVMSVATAAQEDKDDSAIAGTEI